MVERLQFRYGLDYMRYALKGTEIKGMKAPEGIVSNGGEYYMKERLTTSSDLALENGGVAPRPIPQSSRRTRQPSDDKCVWCPKL